MKKEIICTVCPMGCHITVESDAENNLSLEGYSCKRGLEYATNEFLHPVRILTSTVKTDDEKNPLLPIRSNQPIPKEKIMDCMKQIRHIQVSAPVKPYDVIIKNVCDTGCDIVATGTL